MFDEQLKSMRITFSKLEKHEHTAFKKLSTMDANDLLALVADNIPDSIVIGSESGPMPFYKARPFGCIACCIIADSNWSTDYFACMQISDPTLRSDCIQKAWKAYCNAIDACGGVK